MRTKKLIFIIFVFCFFSCQSCEEKENFYKNSKNINSEWMLNDTVKFEFLGNQMRNQYNIFFILRNNNEYPYRNIYLLTKLKTPKGEEKIDTLEYQLAKASGEWLGDGMGAVKQNKLVYKSSIAFRDSGDYQIQITHGMRDEKLKGIEGVSLLIDEIKNDK